MKKLFTLLLMVGVIFTACEDLQIDEPQQPQIQVVGGNESLSLDFLSDESLSKTITFSANYEWSVTASDEWIKVTPDRGEAGEECQVTVTLDRNNTNDIRNGKITICVKDYSIDVPVSQQPKNDLMLSHSEVSLPQSGGAFDITVLSNVNYKHEIKVDWIKAVETRALAENKVRFVAEANPTTDPRTGEIIFKGEGLTATLTVKQSQTNLITLSTSTIEVGGEDGHFSVDVSANIDYEIVIEEGCDWISYMATRAVTTSTLTFAVSKNETESARSATISISGKDIEEKITVNQAYVVSIPSNTIYYTTTNNALLDPYDTEVFNVKMLSNVYSNGQGVMTFDGEITTIGKEAFLKCTTLYSISIPESITSIGTDAFNDCTSLARVNISNLAAWCNIEFANYRANPLYNSAKIYLNDAELRNLVVPFGVTQITNLAFYKCKRLTNISIPDSVTKIGSSAFSGCTSLTSVTIGKGVTEIGENAFYDCTGEVTVHCNIPNSAFKNTKFTKVTIDDSVSEIGSSAFNKCTSLTSATIGNSVTSIGKSAFSGCSSLASVAIPDSVTEIGERAFYRCSSLASATISNNVTILDKGVFTYCASLTSVVIPDSITTIIGSAEDNGIGGTNIYGAFAHCTNLAEITMGKGVNQVQKYSFHGCNIKKINITDLGAWTGINFGNIITPSSGAKLYLNGSEIKDLVIPEGIETVGNFTFYGLGLTSVVCPDSITSIGELAFANNYDLTSVKLSKNLELLCDGVFANCNSLENITLPESLTILGGYTMTGGVITNGGFGMVGSPHPSSVGVFANCSSLKSITIPANVKEIAGNVFNNSGLESVYLCPTTPPTLTNITIPAHVKIYVPEELFITYMQAWSKYETQIYVMGEPSENVIYYTSSDGQIVNPKNSSVFGEGVSIISNVYEDGKGKITFNRNPIKIGDSAFRNCSKLTSITIPDYVISIGVQAFEGCTSLTSVTIGNSVTSIGSSAFRYCKSLASITIPDSVTSIGSSAFSDCKNVGHVVDGIRYIDNAAVERTESRSSYTIKEGTRILADYLFSNRTLTSVTIPDSVTSIGEGAFSSCKSLTSVTIPDSVTSIGKGAFFECTSLTSVTIGKGVTEIGEYAFQNCAGELTVHCNIPNSAFEATKFTKVTIGDSVTLIGKDAFYDCKSLTSVTIPDSVTEIGENAFYKCTSLSSVTIPDSVTSIGSSAFKYCSSLTSVTIPDSITSIGEDTFYGCSSLTSVTIPDSVTSIGDEAFRSCTSLTSVYCTSTVPPTMGIGVFSGNSSDRKIYVPTASVSAYKASQDWSIYASAIVGYDF